MDSSDEEAQHRESLMEEAIKILNQEGFSLPGDVVDTLHTVSRSNAAARKRGSLRGHRVCEVQSREKKVRNERESDARRSRSREDSSSERNENFRPGRRGAEEASVPSSQENFEKQASDAEPSANNRLEREESSESSSTCSASTVKEMHKPSNNKVFERQDSASSLESSASSLNKKRGLSRLESAGSDTGYSTSIENVIQTREAKAENLRNMNKATENNMSKTKFNGLKRDISRDSGFTEPGCNQYQQLVSNGSKDAHALTTKDFNDITISKSDVSERFAASDHGEAHVVTSSATDLTAAQMTSKGEAITDDGTVVSSSSDLENQESNSTLLRVTNKRTEEEVAKEDDYESVNRTSKSSRNESVSTDVSGQTTAASRHAASIEQGLYKEHSKLSKSEDGTRVAADMSVDQQLSRNQEMNNTERSDDGSSKVESKKTSEKALTSKALKEEKIDSGDGSLSGTVSSSQNMDSNVRSTENDETITTPDGRIIKRRQDSLTSSMNETTSSEQTTVKQLPYGGGSSKEIVKKSDSSSLSKSSKVQSERSETAGRVKEIKHEEDNKSVSSNFSGTCESEENINGLKLKRMKSTEKSSESSLKSSKSTSSYSGRGDANELDGNRRLGRRLSEESDASNLSGISGLSRDSIKPPSYEETISNISRHGSLGSLCSAYSRQDSTASSIASSAEAFNERQRQKQLQKERTNSFEMDSKRDADNDYSIRRYKPLRQDSCSSDSTLSGGDLYEGREIVHPIRKSDTYAYGRSHTDSSVGQNRRATLLGDVILTERELQRAREDIYSNSRGRDDNFIGDSGRYEGTRSHRRNDFEDFSGFGAGSFKNEVMDMVDKFFDDDDDFGFGFGSGRRRTNIDRTRDRKMRSKRLDENPYTVRDDLSKYDYTVDSVRANLVDTEYAASDSGYPVHRQRRKANEFDSDFSDIASESGHNRFSRNRLERNAVSDRNNYSNYNSRAASRGHQDDAYRYAHYSTRDTATSADDILQRAGKSIRDDKEINTSISGRSENISHNRINNYNLDNRNDRKYFSRRDGEYTRRGENSFDMNDAESVNSLPQNAFSSNKYPNEEEFRARSLPNIANSEGRTSHRQYADETSMDDREQWNDRRKRIDKALTWIRSELGVLRTQDKVLMSQFQRCQDSIEELKKQRPWYEVFSDDEEDEDGKHWEDWEIEEFDKSEDRDHILRSHLNNH